MREDFYSGFDGEPEIRFEAKSAGTVHRSVRMWVGYFDDLMDHVPCQGLDWTSVAHAYHNAEGWYDESPWRIPNTGEALKQWKSIDLSKLERIEKSVHAAVLALMCEAHELRDEIWIYWE